MYKSIFLKILIICGLFSSCKSDYKTLRENSVLYAEKEGVANCMTYLFFLNNKKVIQESYCFGLTKYQGTYELKNDVIDIYWKIPKEVKFGEQKNDSIIHHIARLKKYKDRIGHTFKKLFYYRNEDTLSHSMVYNAYDNETKCIEYNTTKDNSDLTFLLKRFSKKEMYVYEKSLKSIKKKGDFILGKEYYPNKLKLNVDTPIVFERKYTIGIPLETSYLFYKQSLMVQYHEWSDFGVECNENFNQQAYREVYKQLSEKIIKIKGQPTKNIGDLTSRETTEFKKIWDNKNEHLELHLYLYNNLRIRLINYWKAI